ncbi:MAG: glycerol-3-phosphate acyltransferase [Lysobacteraceae bacterium]|nr:MAG: glycerol-3-phosphate acyltransferase [Xanthomonadaceae bacterium]
MQSATSCRVRRVDLPAVVAAYLIGSVSFPWLVAWWHGIDLRAVGSRKLGGSNLAAVLGVKWGAVGGLLDAAKGALVVWAAGAFGLSLETQILCALAAVAGQMWPIFHDLDGGRANATGWGAILALDLFASAAPAILLLVAVAARFLVKPAPTRVVPLAALLTFLVWSATIYEVEGMTPAVVAGVLIFLLVLIRRLSADLGQDLATSAPLRRVLVNRALYDRSELQERGAVPLT